MINFIINKHQGQKRIGGEDYVSHPIEVARIVRDKGMDEDTITTALFHDLLEDTDATEEEILELSNETVLVAVKLLTKEKGYSVGDYLWGIAQNEIAKNVKLADRIHNLRSAIVTSLEFRERYIKETDDWYMPLATGTFWEEEMREALEALRGSM